MQSLEDNNIKNANRQWMDQEFPKPISVACPKCDQQLCDKKDVHYDTKLPGPNYENKPLLAMRPIICFNCGYEGFRVL